MVSQISSLTFFLLGCLIISSAKYSLSYNNIDNNHIKLWSDGLNDIDSSIFSAVDDLSNARLNKYSIEAIYQFGDSLSDTGNFIAENPNSNFGQYPYGDAYFHKATGRCSDGLLMVDYFAKYLDLPLVDAYLNKEGDFTHGANFAVIGATALDVSTLAAKHIYSYVTNHSLSVQLAWFKSHLASICPHPSECERKIAKALFFVGETGGNDYNSAISGGKPPSVTYELVPEVIQIISNVIEELISLGATQIAVPGDLPKGCMTCYVKQFKSNDTELYDKLKCLKSLNNFSDFHNRELRKTIKKLRKQHPHVTIVYMDLSKAMKFILNHPTALGFDKNAVFKTCCGTGDGEFNFNFSSICGIPGVQACLNPGERVNWDGYHLTSHAYQVMSNWLIRHTFDDISTVNLSA